MIFIFIFIYLDFKKTELHGLLNEFKANLNEQMKKLPSKSTLKSELNKTSKTKSKSMSKSGFSTQEITKVPGFSDHIYSEEGYLIYRKRTNEMCGGRVRSIMGMSLNSLINDDSNDHCIPLSSIMENESSNQHCQCLANGVEHESFCESGSFMNAESCSANSQCTWDCENYDLYVRPLCSNIKKGSSDGYYLEDTTELGLFVTSMYVGMCHHPRYCQYDVTGACQYIPMLSIPKCAPYGPNMNKAIGTTCSDKPDYYHQLQGYFKLGAILMKSYLTEDECLYNLDQARFFNLMPYPNHCERVWKGEDHWGCSEDAEECFMKSGCDSDTQGFKMGFWSDDKWCKGRPEYIHEIPFSGMHLLYLSIFLLLFLTISQN
jgi:hypothetical protein